jgi:hypothetical protein
LEEGGSDCLKISISFAARNEIEDCASALHGVGVSDGVCYSHDWSSATLTKMGREEAGFGRIICKQARADEARALHVSHASS